MHVSNYARRAARSVAQNASDAVVDELSNIIGLYECLVRKTRECVCDVLYA